MKERERERVITIFHVGKYVQNGRKNHIYIVIEWVKKSQNKTKRK